MRRSLVVRVGLSSALALLVASLAVPSTASAQVSYAPAGRPRFVSRSFPIPSSPAFPTTLVGYDGAGHAYVVQGSQLVCGTEALLYDHEMPGLVGDTWVPGVDSMGRGLVLELSRDGWMHLYRGDCTGPAATIVASLPPWNNRLAADVPFVSGPLQILPVAFDDEICVASEHAGIQCMRESGGNLEVTRFIRRDDLAHAVGWDPGYATLYWPRGSAEAAPPLVWVAPRLAFTPTGSLFVMIVARQTGPDGHVYADLSWVAELARTGEIYFHGGPFATGPMDWSQIHGANGIAYEPVLDAIVAHSVTIGDVHTFYISTGSGGDLTTLWNGQGVAVFPIGPRPGYGYLDLTSELYDTIGVGRVEVLDRETREGARIGPNIGQVVSTSDGADWVLPVWGIGPPPGFTIPIGSAAFRLEVDRDTLDLDTDGLSAADETTNGTSDYQMDTDGGGSNDGMEVRLGLDPTDSADDRRGRTGSVEHTTLSRLVRLRAPTDGTTPTPPSRGASWRRPLCSAVGPLRTRKLRCVAADGSIVAESTTTFDTTLDFWLSEDGELAVFLPPGGMTATRALRFSDGQEIDYPPLVGSTMNGQVIALDEHEAFLATIGTDSARPTTTIWSMRVGAAPRQIYDLRTDLDATELPEHPEANAVAQFARVIGWHRETQRLLLYIPFGIGQRLIGVSATEPPVLFERSRALAGMVNETSSAVAAIGLVQAPPVGAPEQMIAAGRDQYLWFSHTASLGLDLRDATLGHEPVTYSLEVPGMTHPRRAWDDTVAFDIECLGMCIEEGLVEYVRVPDRPRPGDVLALIGPEGPGGGLLWRLKRSGPRGGLDPVLEDQNRFQWSDMDVSPSATRLCMVDTINGKVSEMLLRVTAGDTAFTINADLLSENVIACKYDADETLHLLYDSPARRAVYDRATGAITGMTAYEGDGIALLRNPAGDVEVLDASAGYLGATYTNDGHLAGVRNDLTFAVDGRPVLGLQSTGGTVEHRRVTDFVHEDFHDPDAVFGNRWQIVQRPDGLFVLLSTTPRGSIDTAIIAFESWGIVLDPWTGRAEPLGLASVNRGGYPGALAIVPGGPSVDPWTGATIARGPIPEIPVAGTGTPPGLTPEETPPLPMGPGMPAVVVTDGCTVANAGRAGSRAGFAGSSAVVSALALTLCALVRRRRERRRATAA